LSSVTLNYKEYGQGRPLVILHGLFGSLDNWFSLAKSFAETHHVYLVDQRNHGQSPHTATHTYAEMAEDLFGFFAQHGLTDAVMLGHSMGGKTAMTFAADHPELLSKLVVVDMGVRAYPVHHDLIIRAMQAVGVENIGSRKEAEEELARLLDEGNDTLQFLLKNIYRKKEENGASHYAWRFNLDVLANDIEEMGLPILKGSDVETLFLYGTRSDYVKETDLPTILSLFPNAHFETLNTGHWVHAEDPEGFVNQVSQFLKQ
jgi:pimeloyl-ACP methyl ester carboxylesterase